MTKEQINIKAEREDWKEADLRNNYFIEQGRKEREKEIIEIIKNWDVEPCCYGIRQDQLIKKIMEKN